jgi:hypothetical protein
MIHRHSFRTLKNQEKRKKTFKIILNKMKIFSFPGMCPDSLRDALKAAKRPPKFLYINPTGSTLVNCLLEKKLKWQND